MTTRTHTGEDSGPRRRRSKKARSYLRAVREDVAAAMAAGERERSAQLVTLGRQFRLAAERGNPETIETFLAAGMPVNHQEPHTLQTALHAAAAAQARGAVRVLIKQPDIDYLIRDFKGRLPSELAYLFGRDPALARLLGNKERKQAAAQGVKLTRRASVPG